MNPDTQELFEALKMAHFALRLCQKLIDDPRAHDELKQAILPPAIKQAEDAIHLFEQ